MSEKREAGTDVLDWENRTLCSDGNCIGVIGPDGRCKECGMPHDGYDAVQNTDNGDAAPDKTPDDPRDATVSDFEAETETEAEASVSGHDFAPEDDDWENRTLCVDGNCIGVIGPDGRCKTCGKHYPG